MSYQRAVDEATAWLARLRGNASEAEHADFAAWLADDEDNIKAFDEMTALWTSLSVLADVVDEPRPVRSGWRVVKSKPALPSGRLRGAS